nr:NAD-dependent epimerase/dehydratase family protein [Brevibacillus laterosporus]
MIIRIPELIRRGHQVTLLDNLYTGSFSHHSSLFACCKIVEDSVTNAEVVDQLISNADGVFHLAAILGVRTTMTRPVELIDTNLQGTRNVLNSAEKYGVKVVFASTSEVYGKGQPPFTEESDRLYGFTRLLSRLRD